MQKDDDMKNKISIMGIDVDLVTVSSLSKSMNEYLTNDYLNIIYFVTAKTIESVIHDEEYRNSIASSDLVLPAQELLLDVTNPNKSENIDYVSDYDRLQLCFPSLDEEHANVFVVSQEVEPIERYLNYRKRSKKFNIVGRYTGDIIENEEQIINEINSSAPDLLIFAMDSPMQEIWISKNSSKLNAKLCLALAGARSTIFKQYVETPKIIKRIGAERLYHWFKCKNSASQFRQKRIFKRNLENYTSNTLR